MSHNIQLISLHVSKWISLVVWKRLDWCFPSKFSNKFLAHFCFVINFQLFLTRTHKHCSSAAQLLVYSRYVQTRFGEPFHQQQEQHGRSYLLPKRNLFVENCLNNVSHHSKVLRKMYLVFMVFVLASAIPILFDTIDIFTSGAHSSGASVHSTPVDWGQNFNLHFYVKSKLIFRPRKRKHPRKWIIAIGNKGFGGIDCFRCK